MSELQPVAIVEQVAAHLREGIRQGRWRDEMPGRDVLARELGVSPMTVVRSLKLLEDNKILAPQGTGRRRRILHSSNPAPTSQRVVILPYESIDRKLDFGIGLQHQLHAHGHSVTFASKSLNQMKMDVTRVARLVQKTEADAWVVVSGSREILEWFSRQPKPTFALFGRRGQVSIAAVGPDKAPLYAAATARLIGLGHRRISLVCRRQRRLPQPGQPERAFLHELAAHGIPTGDFNLPDWEESKKGFVTLLDSLFGTTPPTALILDESFLFNAASVLVPRASVPPLTLIAPVLARVSVA